MRQQQTEGKLGENGDQPKRFFSFLWSITHPRSGHTETLLGETRCLLPLYPFPLSGLAADPVK